METATFLGIFCGVVEQIGHYLHQALAIALELDGIQRQAERTGLRSRFDNVETASKLLDGCSDVLAKRAE